MYMMYLLSLLDTVNVFFFPQHSDCRHVNISFHLKASPALAHLHNKPSLAIRWCLVHQSWCSVTTHQRTLQHSLIDMQIPADLSD